MVVTVPRTERSARRDGEVSHQRKATRFLYPVLSQWYSVQIHARARATASARSQKRGGVADKGGAVDKAGGETGRGVGESA